jgi:hypothetical protein
MWVQYIWHLNPDSSNTVFTPPSKCLSGFSRACQHYNMLRALFSGVAEQ